MLGDLPALSKNASVDKDRALSDKDVNIALSLEYKNQLKPKDFMKSESKRDYNSPDSYDPNIPKEFLCAINGHVMKEPVRAKTTGLVFEAATIELWLATRGSVCPITGSTLEKSDLVPADDLRNK